MTSGELYSTPLEYVTNVLVTRYRQYYPQILPSTAPPGALTLDDYLLYWNNTINKELYRNQAKHTWMLSVTATPETVNGFDVAALTFELRFNRLCLSFLKI